MLHVSCAIIRHDHKILLAQRSLEMSNPLKWEFPGGKLHKNETAWASVVREIDEELNLSVECVAELPPYTFEYPDFTICLHPFVCVASGEMVLREHADARYLLPEACAEMALSGADIGVLQSYINYLNEPKV